MQDLDKWREAISMMLFELVQKAEVGDADAVSAICDTIDGQLSQVIALAPDAQATH